MNFHSSSINFLVAVVSLMVVCNGIPMSPPARLAGHDRKSAVVYNNVTSAKSRIASSKIATQDRNTLIVCCGPLDSIDDKSVHQTCLECIKMCKTKGMAVNLSGFWQIEHCRCNIPKFCPNIGYVRQVTFDDSCTERTQNNYISSSSSTSYGSFATSAAYKTVFYRASYVSCISMIAIAFLYVFGVRNNQYITYSQNLLMSFTLLTYVNAVAHFQKHPTIDDFRLSGM